MVGRPRKQPQPYPNRIREHRDARGWSLEKLAEIMGAGWNKDKISRVERGETKLKTDVVQAFAIALNTRPEMLTGQQAAMVPVLGYVGAAAEVFPFEDGETDQQPCPPHMKARSTVAFVVRGDSMLPIGDGWMIFAEALPNVTDHARFLNQLCVVDLVNGKRLIKQVRQGYQPKTFNLISTNAAPMENVSLTQVALVGEVRPPTAVTDLVRTSEEDELDAAAQLKAWF